MSGLYNLLFRVNPYADRIVGALGLDLGDFGRFRDAFRAEGGAVVYTRIGGGNRQDYEGVIHRLRGWPLYVRDEDDPFDITYATFYFRLPPPAGVNLDEYLGPDIGRWNPGKRWREKMAWLKTADPATDPEMARIIEEGRKVLAPVAEAMRSGRVTIAAPLGRDPKKVFGDD